MRKLLVILCLALLLTGCRSTVTLATPDTYNAAENVYFSGYINQSVTAIVLPDGRFFVPLRSGVAVGQGTVSSNIFTGAYSDFSGSSSQPGTINATFATGSSFNATLSENGSSLSVQGVALPSNEYNLGTAASLTNFSTHYVATMTGQCGLDVAISATHLTIDAQPADATPSCPCAFSGILTPDASNNFYNVAATFPATGCAFQSQTVKGIAVFYESHYLGGTNIPAFLMVFTTPDAAAMMTGVLDPNNPAPVP